MSIKYIHSADLHLDSPLKGLGTTDPIIAAKIRETTRKAFENLVSFAIQEKVSFILIAGDLVDGRWDDTATGLWTLRQFKRLNEHRIRVFIVFGNHDLQNRMIQSLSWPENVFVFPSSQAETVLLEDERIAIHGQSYSKSECRTNLSLQYPVAENGYFNIGLLHTSLAGENSNDPYSPTSLALLNSKQYDYWALGHTHFSQTFQEIPFWIGYSGMLQGRHVRETGAKGFLVCELEKGRLIHSPQFIESDVLRWFLVEWDLSNIESSSSSLTQWKETFLSLFEEKLSEIQEAAEHRFAAVRFILSGKTPLHQLTLSIQSLEDWTNEIHLAAQAFEASLWIEEIQWKTSLLVDISLFNSSGLLGELLNEMEKRCQSFSDNKNLNSFQQQTQEHIWFQDLQKRIGSKLEEAGIDLEDSFLLQQYYEQARDLLINSFDANLE
ncbi:MAG: DNA repair exonuclease [Planctomycetia bacterium]|nr:DNA repair exonuclease [Planctomycetia bacterium]